MYGISVAESQTFLLAKRPSVAMSEEKRLPFAGYILGFRVSNINDSRHYHMAFYGDDLKLLLHVFGGLRPYCQISFFVLLGITRNSLGVETCNSRAMLVNIHFYHIWKP